MNDDDINSTKDIIDSFKNISNSIENNSNLQNKLKSDKLNWQKFENIARKSIEEKFDCILNNGKINIQGKAKNFDLLNIDDKIVGDIKHYKMTSGGNNPSAKFSVLNEYAWLMQKLEQYARQKWRKIFVIGTDLSVVEKYISIFNAWLDDIEIYFCDDTGKLTKMR
jgi:hypothetical protein